MTLSAADAINLLDSGNYTIAELLDLSKQVSGKVEGATTNTYLLYSGQTPPVGVWASDIAVAIKEAGGGLTVSGSQVGLFLESDEFDFALREAIKLENPTATPAEIIQKMNLALYGKDAAGNRINFDSFWDNASKSFVAEADGNFRIIAPTKLDDLSVFVQSELPALLDNSKITLIDGIQRTDLLALKNSYGLEAVKKLITFNSLSHVMFTELSTFNIDDYINLTQDKLSDLAADMAKRADMEDFLNAIDDTTRAYYEEGRTLIQEIVHESSGFGSVFKKALAPVALTVGLALVTYEAGAAELAGDHEKAKDIMIHWALETVFSEVGALAAGAIAAIGAAALVAAGTISEAVAAVLVLGTALAGGFFGAEGATELYELLQDKNDNDRLDIIDKLADLLFGDSGSADLPDDLDGGTLTFIPAFEPNQIAQHAKTDLAWRYALQQLNPFIIPDIAYDQHNTDGSLDLYNPATGEGVITEQWLIRAYAQ